MPGAQVGNVELIVGGQAGGDGEGTLHSALSALGTMVRVSAADLGQSLWLLGGGKAGEDGDGGWVAIRGTGGLPVDAEV